MKRIEALADAISNFNGFKQPESTLYQLRNPGGLSAFVSRHIRNEDGLRVFESFIDGYKALLYDLEKKCKGESNCGLKHDSSLVELVRVFKMKDETTGHITKHIRKALGIETITEDTPIGWFWEGI